MIRVIKNLLIIVAVGLFAVGVSAQGNIHYYSIPNLFFEVEQRRLDNVSETMRSDPNKIVYLVAYNKTGKKKITAINRLKKSKNYLIKKYDVSFKRIITIYGGSKADGIVMDIFILDANTRDSVPVIQNISYLHFSIIAL